MKLRSTGASPIQDILFVALLEPQHASRRFTATSQPGHLLHFEISGRVRQQCNNRVYDLEPGKLLWYHEDEWVTGEILQAPWRFYSINFIAPTLAPPAEAARLFAPPARVGEYFAAAVHAWDDESLSPQSRALRCHANLLLILEELSRLQPLQASGETSGQLWWEIEARARVDLSCPLDLKQLEKWSGRGAATITRSCRVALGESPMRRLKHIRLQFARGLVLRSSLAVGEIASRIGYARVHEFSRDYKTWFGVSPSHDRRDFENTA